MTEKLNQMQVYYISVEGNTKHFVMKMKRMFHNVSLHRIDDQTDLFKIKTPFFVFVPSYASYRDDEKKCVELPQTYAMTEQLGWQKNYKHCLATIGSGNRNFSKDQWAWTARLYRKEFSIPILDTYELRGTIADEDRINKKMIKVWNQKTGADLKFHGHKAVNPRLAKLEHKYGKDLLGNKIN